MYITDLTIEGPIDCYAEDMTNHIDSNSVDAVVSTHVLCSVKDVNQCLKEIHRVLKKVGIVAMYNFTI